MLALSIRQPWAELIAQGKKTIENRTWKRDHRGDFLVVASVSRHDDLCLEHGLDPDALVYGKAVCVVEWVDVKGREQDYKWHLRNPRRVEPFSVRGSASFYHVDDSLISYVKAPLTAPAPATKPRPAPRAKRGRGAPVLVACRNARRCALWVAALREAGHNVATVLDGIQAIEHLAQQRAAAVVLDDEIQGYPCWEVIERVRALPAHATTGIVVVGSRGAREDRLRRLGRSATGAQIVTAISELHDAGASP